LKNPLEVKKGTVVIKLYVFDLDGTLADISHRLPFIRSKPKNWKKFLSTTDKDVPIQWVIDLLKIVSSEGEVLILTGRENIARDQTIEWLYHNDITTYFDYLIMRPKGDYRQDTIVKPELLDNFLRDNDYEVQFIVEDRQQVVDKWRELGYNVLQSDAWEEHTSK